VQPRFRPITHHTAPDIDAERELAIDDLKRASMLLPVRSIEGRGSAQEGRKGGGDLYFPGGMAATGVLKP
jgi:hypothetical protein